MNTQKFARSGAKLFVGVLGSALLGYLYKAEQVVESRIDDHFADETTDTDQPTEAVSA